MISKHTRTAATLLSTAALAFTLTTSQAAPRGQKPPIPDFTKGDPVGRHHDWNLGPTEARGWMWGWKDQTTLARQIYVA